jgi:hypothetical protein
MGMGHLIRRLHDATRRYSTLLDATRRYSTLLDATWRYSTLLDATWLFSTLLDATRRYTMLLDATQRYTTRIDASLNSCDFICTLIYYYTWFKWGGLDKVEGTLLDVTQRYTLLDTNSHYFSTLFNAFRRFSTLFDASRHWYKLL